MNARLKTKDIIESLCNHEISKHQAIESLNEIIDSLRKNGAVEFQVDSVSCTIEEDHAYLRLKKPYGYSKIEDRVKKGDKVDVTFLP